VTEKPDKAIDVADPFARQLVARYLERRKQDLGKLRQALDDADFELVRVTGHNLFGSGATYGLEEVSRLGRELERAAEASDGPRIAGLIDELASFVQAVKIR